MSIVNRNEGSNGKGQGIKGNEVENKTLCSVYFGVVVVELIIILIAEE